MAAIIRSNRKKATLTTMAIMNVTFEDEPGLFMAPTGTGLTMERQDILHENTFWSFKRGGMKMRRKEEKDLRRRQFR